MTLTEVDTEQEAKQRGLNYVRVASVDGRYIGFRELGQEKIALQRCPVCRLENYCLNVLSGVCTWCGFDVNKERKQS